MFKCLDPVLTIAATISCAPSRPPSPARHEYSSTPAAVRLLQPPRHTPTHPSGTARPSSPLWTSAPTPTARASRSKSASRTTSPHSARTRRGASSARAAAAPSGISAARTSSPCRRARVGGACVCACSSALRGGRGAVLVGRRRRVSSAVWNVARCIILRCMPHVARCTVLRLHVARVDAAAHRRPEGAVR